MRAEPSLLPFAALTICPIFAATRFTVYGAIIRPINLAMIVTPSPTVNDAFQVQPPTALSLTSGAGIAFVNELGITTGRILATWTAPADTFILNSGSMELQWQAVGEGLWHSSGYIQGAVESSMCGRDQL